MVQPATKSFLSTMVFVPMQAEAISEVVLSTVNFPQNLTNFVCVYQINRLTDSKGRPVLQATKFRGRAKATSHDTEKGLVGCPVSVTEKVLFKSCE